jgi:ParB-like nuclease domain
MKPQAIEVWPVERFRPYEDNPREHKEEAVAQFAQAVRRFGFRVPILARSSGEVVDGRLRLKAAVRVGLTEVPVMLADDMSDDDVRAFRVSVNRMAELAEWDQDALFRELEKMQQAGEQLSETGAVGFELEEFDPAAPAEAWDFGAVHDLFVITLTGSLPMEAEVRKRLEGLQGVTVEVSSLERSSP